MEYIGAAYGVEVGRLAHASACFRALWAMQEETKQLNYVALTDYKLEVDPHDPPVLSSVTLGNTYTRLAEHVLLYRSQQQVRNYIWANYTVTRDERGDVFAKFDGGGTVTARAVCVCVLSPPPRASSCAMKCDQFMCVNFVC